MALKSRGGAHHPLCGVPLLGVPCTYLLIYAPRGAEELRVVDEIVHRAAAFAAMAEPGLAR